MIKAKYTVVLKSLMDNEETNALLNKALSTYPLYARKSKEEYIPSYVPTREELNKKLLNHYKYHEIGFETPGRFFDELEITMNEIMPEYNLLYFSADQDFNIIYNVDYQRTINTDRSGTDKSSTETTGNATNRTTVESNVDHAGKSVESDTPQNQLNISNKNIDSVTYGSKATWSKDDSTDTSTSEGDSETSGTTETSGENTAKEETLETTKGNFGVVSAQDLVLKYRESIINIERKLFADTRIKELFMMIY